MPCAECLTAPELAPCASEGQFPGRQQKHFPHAVKLPLPQLQHSSELLLLPLIDTNDRLHQEQQRRRLSADTPEEDERTGSSGFSSRRIISNNTHDNNPSSCANSETRLDADTLELHHAASPGAVAAKAKPAPAAALTAAAPTAPAAGTPHAEALVWYSPALQLLERLAPFPAGCKFEPSVPLQQTELAPKPFAAATSAAGTAGPVAAAADADYSAASVEPVHGERGRRWKQQQEEQSAGAAAAVPHPDCSGVLLPEKFEALLLQGIQDEQQQQQQQTVQAQQREQLDQTARRSKCFENSSSSNRTSRNSSSSNSSSRKSSSSSWRGFDWTLALVPHCSGCCNSNSGTGKRRAGDGTCWQQIASLLHSLVAAEDPYEQQQQQQQLTDYTRHSGQIPTTTAAAITTSTITAEISAAAPTAAPAAAAAAAVKCYVGSTATAAPRPEPQQQRHQHQSLPAEAARRLLRRIEAASSALHRHHRIQQHEQQEQQERQQEEAEIYYSSCRCSIANSCSGFCAFFCRLLKDPRLQQPQHERLQFLLLQLLLLLLQNRRACTVCSCNSSAFKPYVDFVLQQLQPMLQQQRSRQQQLLLDVHSLQVQKRLRMLLQLALLMRAWRADSSSSSRSVVKVAYLCLLHWGVSIDVREAAADLFAAAALDELPRAASATAASTAAVTETLEVQGPAAPATAATRSAVSLCVSISKAAAAGSSAAATAATEVVSSVACWMLLLLQQKNTPQPAAARGRAAQLALQQIHEFSAETVAPACLHLLRLLLPAVQRPLLQHETLQGTAATPLHLSQHAAETLHLLRLAVSLMQQQQQHQTSQPQQLQRSQQQYCNDLFKGLDSLQHELQQQLLLLLRAALQRSREQLGLLWAVLRPSSLRGRSNSSSVAAGAAAAAEAPLCCVCVLVQLPQAQAAATCPPVGDTLETYVAGLVELLLPFLQTSGPFAAVAAATGCFSKILLALTEATRSVCKQVQQRTSGPVAAELATRATGAATALTQLPTPTAVAAAVDLQESLRTAARGVMRFALEAAATEQQQQQQQQIADFIAAAADADSLLAPIAAPHRKQQQRRQQPLACDLLQQILECPVVRTLGNSSRGSSSNTTSSSNNETVCAAASVFPVSLAAIETNAAVVLHSVTRFLLYQRDISAAAGADTAEAASSAADAAGCLYSAWVRLVRQGLLQLSHQQAHSCATSAAAAAAAAVATLHQHTCAIIEARGGLLQEFSAAVGACGAALEMPLPVRSKLKQLQQEFVVLLRSCTVAAAHTVLALLQPNSSSTCCCNSSRHAEHLADCCWNVVQQQDPVGVLRQLLETLILQDSLCVPPHSSGCCRCCLWPLLLRVAAAVSSLRPLTLQICMRQLRCLLAMQQRQQQQNQQQQQQQQRQQLEAVWFEVFLFYCGEKPADAESNCSSCCCSRVRVSDLLHQDDWIFVSNLLLELLQLLQQTACGVSPAAAAACFRMEAAAATLQRATAAERLAQEPPQTKEDDSVFFPLNVPGPCSSSEHPDCLDE